MVFYFWDKFPFLPFLFVYVYVYTKHVYGNILKQENDIKWICIFRIIEAWGWIEASFFQQFQRHCRIFLFKNLFQLTTGVPGSSHLFDQIKYVFKIWLNRSEKSCIVHVQLGSKYASVSMILHLTFLERT